MMLFVTLCLISQCTGYNPAFYPSYDVLNPGPEVRENPLGWIPAGTEIEIDILPGTLTVDEDCYVINKAFLMWTFELKEEVKKLRKQLK